MREQTQGLDQQDTLLLNSLAKETGSLEGQGEGELEGTHSGRSQGQGEDGQDRKARQQATQFSSVQWLSRVRLFATPWTTACQASLSIINSHSMLKLMSIENLMNSMKRPLREESKLDT